MDESSKITDWKCHMCGGDGYRYESDWKITHKCYDCGYHDVDFKWDLDDISEGENNDG